MKVIKRNGVEVDFDSSKIIRAVSAANKESSSVLSDTEIKEITDEVVDICTSLERQVSVEEIQDMVENALMKRSYHVAKCYVRYRYDREKERNGSTLKRKVLSIVEGTDEESRQENSNKNVDIAPTQRDYIAGVISREIADEILDSDIVEAHHEGKIHFHDTDYFVEHISNCCLVNLKDMFDNGTVISGTYIDRPKTFSTACTIATQIIAQVASSQYGGQTISLAHLAPFIDETRKKFYNDYSEFKGNMSDEEYHDFIEKMVKFDLVKGVQTIQYQLITLMTTNGQAPFVTVYMYIDEVPEGVIRDDLVMLIEEVIRQRIKGVKNEKGVWSTTAFPKLIYVLDEDNTYEDSKYFWLTKLSAECSAKRMVPDYISAKKMREYKKGQVYPCMGCLDGDTTVIMYDGSQKKARDIVVGDKLMGTDSDAREVLELTHGYDNMYRIKQNRAEDYVVNSEHIMSLVWSRKRPCGTWKYGDVINIPVVEYLKLPTYKKKYLKGYKKGYDAVDLNLGVPAYLLGLWLGDGDRNCPEIIVNKDQPEIKEYILGYAESKGLKVTVTEHDKSAKVERLHIRAVGEGEKFTNDFLEGLKAYGLLGNKHIPEVYFRASAEQRKQLLAGLINTDGSVNRTRHQFYNSDYRLICDAKRLADSLGLTTKVLVSREEGEYKCCGELKHCETQYTLTIMGFKCDRLLDSKRIKEAAVNNDWYTIGVELVGPGEYFGVNIDGNQLYLLGDGTVTHNCRAFLTPEETVTEDGNMKFYGRFNQGAVTVNLPYIACESGGDFEKFWKIFDERMELCHRALQRKHERLEGTPSDIAPIMWQYGAVARLKKGETLDKLLHDFYSTISLGYAGLYECVKYMTGSSHTSEEGKGFAIEVMNKLNSYTRKWREEENIAYSLYGTPLETTTYKFAKALQTRFGKIPGVSDKNYITNSYHVHVTEDINAFDKLNFEAEFQHLSPGGAISYVEIPDMSGNIEAVIKVIQYIYETIMYAELNSKFDMCLKCGYEGEIKVVEEDFKLIWECPCCGNRDQHMMVVPRRTCGYIGMQFWNQGRTQEIKDRKLHL